ncbi:MAG: hypothetical protein WCO56_03500 [Verrucomicrobiota bacterium]
MKDLTNPRWMWLKAGLLLLIGVVAALLLLLEAATVKTAVLLGIVIWSFCRAYYFAFYVIEHYVDPGYRFSGLLAFLRYALRRKV